VGLREVYGVSVSAAFPYRLRELRRLKQREVQVGSIEVVLSPLLAVSSAAEFSLRLRVSNLLVSPRLSQV